jgi:hypothetical protein
MRLTGAALHLANDDIENCHLIAQAHEGVSVALEIEDHLTEHTMMTDAPGRYR